MKDEICLCEKECLTPAANISEYRIGNTTYIVEIHFNLVCKETLDDIVKRLISRDAENLMSAA